MASVLEFFVNTVRHQSGKLVMPFNHCKTQKINFRNIRISKFFLGKPREVLEACRVTKDILVKHANYLDNVLETLDIQQHTIGVMFVITAKFTNITVSYKYEGPSAVLV